MASVSVSHMILFIASILIAASVAGVFTSTVDNLSQAIDDQGVHVSDSVRTDVEIISDNGTGACVYNCEGNEELVLYVKNTGSSRLSARADHIEVMIDGRFQPAEDLQVTLLGDAETWRRNDVIELRVSESGLQGDHRAMVIVNGDEEEFEFRVP